MSYNSGFSPEFEAFAAETSAAAIHQQNLINEALGGVVRVHKVDERTLVGDDLTLRDATLLGSFSHLSKTWLWTWENPHFGWDHPMGETLRKIHDFGERHEIPELTIGHLDLSMFPQPHQAASTMAIAAGTLLGGNGVWSSRINDGKGSQYVHLDDPQLPVATFDPEAAPGLIKLASEVFPGDPRRVVRGFFQSFNMPFEENPTAITGESGTYRVVVSFTDEGRLSHTDVIPAT
jgi:hypothetical protein